MVLARACRGNTALQRIVRPRPSGLTVEFEARAPEGARIKAVAVAGRPLELDKTYTIGGCDREGEPLETICRVRDIKSARVKGSAHSALAAYIRKHSPLDLKREGRVRASDLPDAVSQYDPRRSHDLFRLLNALAARPNPTGASAENYQPAAGKAGPERNQNSAPARTKPGRIAKKNGGSREENRQSRRGQTTPLRQEWG